MASQVGILGTGRMGSRLAATLARAGNDVILGSRDPARAAAVARGLGEPRISAGSYEEALAAPAVLPAVFIRDGLLDLLAANERRLRGKLVIDISNPFNDDYSDFLTPWDWSAAEEIRRVLPRARLVGAFKHVYWEVLDEPHFSEVVSDVLVVGDDDEAKEEFFRLVERAPFRFLDAGPLIYARAIERMTIVTGTLGRRLGTYPRMNWRLLG